MTFQRNIEAFYFGIFGGTIDHLSKSLSDEKNTELLEIEFADEILRPYTVSFTDDGSNMEVKLRELTRYLGAVDLLIHPTLLYYDYLGVLVDKKVSSDTYPFENFIIDKLMAKTRQNIERYTLFKGVRNGSGTAPKDVCNGLLKIIALAITASEIPTENIYDTPEDWTLTNSRDLIEDIFYNVVPSELYQTYMKCFVSPEIYSFYTRDYMDEFKSMYALGNGESWQNPQFIRGTKTELIPSQGLIGEKRIIISPKENLVCGLPNLNDIKLNIQPSNRSLKIMLDVALGLQIRSPKLIFTNNPEAE